MDALQNTRRRVKEANEFVRDEETRQVCRQMIKNKLVMLTLFAPGHARVLAPSHGNDGW